MTTYLYIIPGIGNARIIDFEIGHAKEIAMQYCKENHTEYLEQNLHSVGPVEQIYKATKTPSEKAIDFLLNSTIDKMSAYVSLRMYNTIETNAKHKNLFEILTNYNAYRNGIWHNFGQKSIHELVTVLHDLFGIKVPENYYYRGYEKIEITVDNVLEFFVDKKRFDD